jgi:hypothetical protein
VNAVARTLAGTFVIDLEDEEVIGEVDAFEPAKVNVELPRVVAAAASGATIVAVVDRRPPLAISNDAGRTWREAGGGLPPGFAIAVHEDNPDLMLFSAPRGKHPCLPLLPRARETVDTGGRQSLQRAEVRPQRRDLLRTTEREIDVTRPEVVDLDG